MEAKEKALPLRDAKRTSQVILTVAEKHFSEKGFYGARVDEIAKDANINKRMIYQYHINKETLYQNVLLSVYSRMEETERMVVEENLTGTHLIRAIIAKYFAFLQENPTFVNILMWENLDKGRSLSTMPTELVDRRETISYFVDDIKRGKESGIFNASMDENHMMLSLITVCFANFSNRYTLTKLFHQDLGDSAFLEERKQHTTDMILAYMTQKNE